MSDSHGFNEEVRVSLDTTRPEFTSGDLIKELEILIDNVRQNCMNDERLKQSQDRLFAFNVGLLCGLKQGKK